MKQLFKKLLAGSGWELRRLSANHTTPVSSEWMGRFFYFVERYHSLAGVEGDIVECGIGRGRTFLYLAFLLAQDPTPRTLWGFDSFEGFPEPSEEDTSFRNAKKGELGNTSEELIHWMLRDAGIPKSVLRERVRLVKGFFKDTLPKSPVNKIALLHIDVDLYEAYRECLAAFYPKVSRGGVVLFDEYDDPAYPGGRKAIDEYFAREGIRPRVYHDELSGKHYLIKE